jgi:hypothetical protein
VMCNGPSSGEITTSLFFPLTVDSQTKYIELFTPKEYSARNSSSMATHQGSARRSKSGNMDDEGHDRMFGVVFGDGIEEGEVNKGRKSRKQCEVILPPSSSRFKRKSSRAYTRPIFKEPGSKMVSVESLDDPDSEVGDVGAKSSESMERSSSVVNDLLREVRSLEHGCDHDEVIQPSNSASARLQRFIIGRPIDRFPLDDTDQSVGLETRVYRKADGHNGSIPRHDFQQRRHHSGYRRDIRHPSRRSLRLKGSSVLTKCASSVSDYDDQTECGGSIATVSDLDNLEAKALRRMRISFRSKPRNDLIVLKQEIKDLMGSLDERDDSQPRGAHQLHKEEQELQRMEQQKKELQTEELHPKQHEQEEQEGLKMSNSDEFAASKSSASQEHSDHSTSEGMACDGLRDDTGDTDGGNLQSIASTGLLEMWCEAPTLQNLVDDLKEYCSVKR